MAKTLSFQSLLVVMLVAASANLLADEAETRLGSSTCCPQTGPICDLRVKNNVWVGNTLNAKCINVKCCGKKCPVMVSCEKCVHNVRGRVQFQAETLVPYERDGETTTPLNINVLTGCGFSTTQRSQVLVTDVTTPFVACGLIDTFSAVAATTEIEAQLCLDKPCANLPAIVGTLELEPFVALPGGPVALGPLTFDLTVPFGTPTFVSIQTAVVVVNEIDAAGCYVLNVINNFVACSEDGPDAARVALQDIVNLLLSSQGSVVKLDFIAQCSTDCPQAE